MVKIEHTNKSIIIPDFYRFNLIKIDLIRQNNKFYAIDRSSDRPITLNLPKYFEKISNENLQYVLNKHGKRVTKNGGEIVSLIVFPLLLGGGQVSSKILNASNSTGTTGDNNERIRELNYQIKDMNVILTEWKDKYRELEETQKKKKLEKVIEVPVEVIKYVERPIEVNADEKIKLLQTHIENYEQQINHWKNKNKFDSKVETTGETVIIPDSGLTNNDPDIEEESDNKKLQQIKEKINSLKSFSKQLQNEYIHHQTKSNEITVQKSVNVVKYIDTPVETITIDNSTVEELKNKVQSLKNTIKDLESRYEVYEKESLRVNPVVSASVSVPTASTGDVNRVESHPADEVMINELKNELNNLRSSLNTLQTNNQVIENIVEIPIEVVKYIDRPIKKIINDESKSNELLSQITEIQTQIEDWKQKYQISKRNSLYKPQYETAEVQNYYQEVEDERIQELKGKIEVLQSSLTSLGQHYLEVSSTQPTIIEKLVEVEVPVTKYIEKQVEVYYNDDKKVTELENKISRLKEHLAKLKNRKSGTGKQPKVFERLIEVPEEVDRYVEKKIFRKLVDDQRIQELTSKLNELQESLAEWESKCNNYTVNQNPEIEIVEKIVEIPIEVVRYVDEIVYVDSVDEEKLKQVTRDYEALQRTIEEWKGKYDNLTKKELKIVETPVEVPIEVIQFVDIPVEVLVVDENKLNSLQTEHTRLLGELEQIKTKISMKKMKKKKIVEKIVEVPVERIEYIDNEVEVIEVDENLIFELTNECNFLQDQLTSLQNRYETLQISEAKVIDKNNEIPIEVIEYLNVDKAVEIKPPELDKINLLNEEHDKLMEEIQLTRDKLREYESIPKTIVKKEVEVEYEKIVYIDKIVEVIKVDEEKLKILSKLHDELLTKLQNWKAKFKFAQQKTQKKIDRIVEIPIEKVEYINNEIYKTVIDNEKISKLKSEYGNLIKNISNLKSECTSLQRKKVNIQPKYIDVLYEDIQYKDQFVDALTVNDEKLKQLKLEIENLTVQHELLTQKYSQLTQANIQTIEKKILIPQEIIQYFDYEVEVLKVDEEKIKDLFDEINHIQTSIYDWRQKYNKLKLRENNIVPVIEEVPIELVRYYDIDVDTMQIDDDSINFLKQQYEKFGEIINTIQSEIHALEKEEGDYFEKIVRVPAPVTQVLEREVEVIKIDENRLHALENELRLLKNDLNECRQACMNLQSQDIEIVEKICEVPFEKIVYVDKEVSVSRIDNERVELLQKRINELEVQLATCNPTEYNQKKRKLIEKIIEVPVEVIEHVEIDREVITFDQDELNIVQDEYNNLVKELAEWKVKLFEAQNSQQVIIEKIVEVPIEKIEYVDKIVEVITVDQLKIEQLNLELQALSESLTYWKNKNIEIENIKLRTVDKYVDIPIEKVELIEKEIVVVKVDDERIKLLENEYNDYLEKIEKLKHEINLNSKLKQNFIEKIIEIPVEKVEYIEKIVEILVTDQKKLNDLHEEYNQLIHQINEAHSQIYNSDQVQYIIREKLVEKLIEKIEYVDIIETVEDFEKIKFLEDQIHTYTNLNEITTNPIQKIVKLPPVIVEKIVEDPIEVIHYVDIPTEVQNPDLILREKILSDQISVIADKIKLLQEQYECLIKTEDQIVRNTIYMPVEVIKYIDKPVEVVKYDETKINNLENGLKDFKNTLAEWLEKYRQNEESAHDSVSTNTNLTQDHLSKVRDNPHDDRLNSIATEITNLNKFLQYLNEKDEDYLNKQKIVEVPVEIPVEVIKYIDRPYEVIKTDDIRIKNLQNEIASIKESIEEFKKLLVIDPSSSSNPVDTISHETIQSVLINTDETENIPRAKVTLRNDNNLEWINININQINEEIEQWKNKYTMLTQNDRKIVDKVVEVPIEVIKYVDKYIPTFSSDDARIKSLEEELVSMTKQFNDIAGVDFTSTPIFEVSPPSNKLSQSQYTMKDLPTSTRINPDFLRIKSKITNFNNEFNNLKQKLNELNSMKRVILEKAIGVPKEVAVYLEQTVDIYDYRPQQFLKEIQQMNLKLECWLKSIESNINLSNSIIYKNKLKENENILTETPTLIRDYRGESLLENELVQITNLISEYENKLFLVNSETEQIIINNVEIKKLIENIILKEDEIIVKDASHEEYLQNLINLTELKIKEKTSQYEYALGNSEKLPKIISKVIEVHKEVEKLYNRTINIVRYDYSQIKEIEEKYKLIEKELESIIAACTNASVKTEYDIVEKIVEVPKEVIRTVSRQIFYEKLDERPILEKIDELNRISVQLQEYLNELNMTDLDNEVIIEKEILVEKEVVKYIVRDVEVVLMDNRPVKDLEDRKVRLRNRIDDLNMKINLSQAMQDQPIIQEIHYPVIYRKEIITCPIVEIQNDTSHLYEMIELINELHVELCESNRELAIIKASKDSIEEELILIPVEVIKTVENIIEKIIWDDTPIKDLQYKIEFLTQEISQLEDETITLETSKDTPVENIIEVIKEIKRFELRDIEIIQYDEEPVQELERRILDLHSVYYDWQNKVKEMNNNEEINIERIIEIPIEKILKKTRIKDLIKNDDKPIKKSIEKIERLHAMIQSAKAKLDKSESKKPRIIEKIVQIPVEMTVIKPRRKEIIKWDETSIKELESVKQRRLDELRNLLADISELEKIKNSPLEKVIQIPKKVINKKTREIQKPFYDTTEMKEWDEKCEDRINEIKYLSKLKLEIARSNNRIVEKIVEIPYEIIFYRDHKNEIIKWDETPIKFLENEIAKTQEELQSASQRKNLLSNENYSKIEKIIEIPKEVIKYEERITEKIIWDDSIIHQLEEKIHELVNKLNDNLNQSSNNENFSEFIQEKIVEVPIVKYVNTYKDIQVYDDSIIIEVKSQITSIKEELEILKEKTSHLIKAEPIIIEKSIEKPVEVLKKIENKIEKIIFDEQETHSLLNKVNESKRQLESLKSGYYSKLKKSEEVTENTIYVEKIVPKVISQIKEKVVFDNTKILEYENKIKIVNEEYNNSITNLNEITRRNETVLEKIVEVEKPITRYEEIIVKKYVEDNSLLILMENKIRELKIKLNDMKADSNNQLNKKQEIIEKIKEVPVEVIKKIERKIKINDDSKIKNLEDKLKNLMDIYNNRNHQLIEIIEEPADIIEKIILIPKKNIKIVNRTIEKIIDDHSKIISLEAIYKEKNKEYNSLSSTVEQLIVDKNTIREETVEIEQYVYHYIERPIEVVTYDSRSEVLQSDVINLRNNFNLILEQHNQLHALDREIVYKTVEVPYETIRYIDKEIEIFEVDEKKVAELEEKLKQLKNEENYLNTNITSSVVGQAVRNTKNIENIQNIQTIQNIVYVDRPVKRIKVDEEQLILLNNQMISLSSELNEWKNKCDTYDITREKLIEVPYEVIKQREYPVEIIKADDNLVNSLAFEVNSLRSLFAKLEAKHDIILENSNSVEDVQTQAQPMIKYIDREVNVVKLDNEKLDQLNSQIKNLKMNVSQYPLKQTITHKTVEVEAEHVTYINRPEEIITIDSESMEKIEDGINKAYSLLNEWKANYQLIFNDIFTPEEKIVEIPVEIKKFGVCQIDNLVIDEDEYDNLQTEIEKLNQNMIEFQNKINMAKINTNQTFIREKIVEVPLHVEKYVDHPTHIYGIDSHHQANLKRELELLKETLKKELNE